MTLLALWFAVTTVLAAMGWRLSLNRAARELKGRDEALRSMCERADVLAREASAYAVRIDRLVREGEATVSMATGLQALLDERQAVELELRSKLEVAQVRLDEELAIKAASERQLEALRTGLKYHQDLHKKDEQRLVEADRQYAEDKARWQDREGMMKAQKDAADAELGKMLAMIARFRKRVQEAERWLNAELTEYQFETREVRPPLEQPSLVAALAQAQPVAKE